MSGVMMMSRIAIPAPADPMTSSRPYGPPETEKKMMPMMAPRPSLRVAVRISTGSVPVEGGVRCEFGSSVPVEELMRLVAAEQDCCPFFQFAITVDTRGVGLEVRGPDDARSIVESMFGAAA